MKKTAILWKNPTTGLEHVLGQDIDNCVNVNCNEHELKFYLNLLHEGGNAGSLYEQNEENTIYLLMHEGKKIVIKKFDKISKSNGLSQFRAMRKLNEAGLESPVALAASESILVSDYFHCTLLWDLLKRATQREYFILMQKWEQVTERVEMIIPEEYRDLTATNGYLVARGNGYKLGIFDQG